METSDSVGIIYVTGGLFFVNHKQNDTFTGCLPIAFVTLSRYSFSVGVYSILLTSSLKILD